MIGWIQYLVYIMSFVIPPVGVVTFWVFTGRNDELQMIGKWAFVAAFVGMVVWCIVAAVGGTMFRTFWGPMGRW